MGLSPSRLSPAFRSSLRRSSLSPASGGFLAAPLTSGRSSSSARGRGKRRCHPSQRRVAQPHSGGVFHAGTSFIADGGSREGGAWSSRQAPPRGDVTITLLSWLGTLILLVLTSKDAGEPKRQRNLIRTNTSTPPSCPSHGQNPAPDLPGWRGHSPPAPAEQRSQPPSSCL